MQPPVEPNDPVDAAEFDDSSTVLLVETGSPGEADVVRGRLDAAGIPYETNQFTSQFALTSGTLARVRLFVEEPDLERARLAIAVSGDEAQAIGWSDEQDAAMATARLERRYKIARFLMYMLVAGHVVTATLFATEMPIDAAVNVASAAVLFALARWSKQDPRRAFMWAFLVVAASAVWTMVVGRPLLITAGLLPLFATYYAFYSAPVRSRATRAG